MFPSAELRVEQTDEGPILTGYAAVFDSLSVDLGGFREKIQRGAFGRTLQEKPDVRALVNHDPSLVLGRTKSGTLDLAEDRKGLAVRIKPPDTQVGRDIVTSIERGDVSQMSFAFRAVGDAWDRGGGDSPPIRTLTDVDLFDVSAVTYPAYPETIVQTRSADLEEFLDDCKHLSEELAKKLAARKNQLRRKQICVL